MPRTSKRKTASAAEVPQSVGNPATTEVDSFRKSRRSRSAPSAGNGSTATTPPAPEPIPQAEPETHPEFPPQAQVLLRELRETQQQLFNLSGEWTGKLKDELAHQQAEIKEVREELNAFSLQVAELIGQVLLLKEQVGEESRYPDENEEVEKDEAQPPEESPLLEHGWLGVTVESAVVVADVLTGSPAALAGLVEGDVIRRINGVPVLDAARLRELIHETPAGEELTIHVLRDGKKKKFRTRFEPIAPAGVE